MVGSSGLKMTHDRKDMRCCLRAMIGGRSSVSSRARMAAWILGNCKRLDALLYV